MYSSSQIVVTIGKPNNNVPLARFTYSKVPANGERSDENWAHWNPKSCMMRGEVKGGRESFEVRGQNPKPGSDLSESPWDYLISHHSYHFLFCKMERMPVSRDS